MRRRAACGPIQRIGTPHRLVDQRGVLHRAREWPDGIKRPTEGKHPGTTHLVTVAFKPTMPHSAAGIRTDPRICPQRHWYQTGSHRHARAIA